MKVLVSAAEASADLHASHLVEALKARTAGLELCGIGGARLERCGLRPVARAADLAVMGSFEILSRLRVIRRAGKDLLAEAERVRPDVAVLVDYPGFHFRIGPRLKQLGIPVVYFIPPKVWVWRRGRVAEMARWVSKVLCILPFETRIYDEAGIPASYVGSPLVEEIPLKMSRVEARARLNLPVESNVLALLPGSRRSEMARHLEPFLLGAARFAQETGRRWIVVLPLASTLEAREWSARAEQILSSAGVSSAIELRVTVGDSGQVMRSADLGLIKSGTSTLEAGLLDCPMVVAYRPGAFTSFAVKHFIRYRGPVGLVNLFLGWREGDAVPVPEVLHAEMTSERLARELGELWNSPERLARMREWFARLREAVSAGGGGRPSERAAEEVLAVATKGLP